MPAYLAWRSASAWTCHTCQVDRDDSRTSTTRLASSSPVSSLPLTRVVSPLTTEHGRDHVGDGRGTSAVAGGQDGVRLGAPLLALLTQAARLVLVGARLEVGLLGQGEGLDPGGRTAVVSLEGPAS